MDRIAEKVLEVNGLEAYDPVIAMALIATDPTIQAGASSTASGQMVVTANVPLALKAHSEVAKYTHPTLKQIEVTGQGGGAIEVRAGMAKEIVDLVMALKAKVPT